MPILSEECKQRIKTIQDCLMELPDANFDLNSYLSLGGEADEEFKAARALPQNYNKRDWELQDEITKQVLLDLKSGERSCGTTACVAGWLPVFFPEDFCHKNGHDIPVFIRGPKSGVPVEVGELAEWLGFPRSWGNELFLNCGSFYRTINDGPGPIDVANALSRATDYFERDLDPRLEEEDDEDDDDDWDDDDDEDDDYYDDDDDDDWEDEEDEDDDDDWDDDDDED